MFLQSFSKQSLVIFPKVILHATSFDFYKIPMKQVRLVLLSSSLAYVGGRNNDRPFPAKEDLKKIQSHWKCGRILL